jgi:germination protein M
LSSGAGAYEFKAEKHRINYTAAEDIAKSLINILISGPDSKELISPFPENVRLLSLSKTNTAMYIKYSDEYLNMTEFEMNLADYCVVKTLSGINGIQKFQFSLDGEPHPVSGYRFVTLEDFITNKNAFQILTRNITLYYPSEDYSGLVARNVSFSMYGHEALENKVISLLLHGDEDLGLSLELPFQARLLSIYVFENTAYLDFSEEFLEYANENDPLRGRLTVYSIVNSLTEIPYIKNVVFKIKGKPPGVYAGINLNEPLARNKSYIGLENPIIADYML